MSAQRPTVDAAGACLSAKLRQRKLKAASREVEQAFVV